MKGFMKRTRRVLRLSRKLVLPRSKMFPLGTKTDNSRSHVHEMDAPVSVRSPIVLESIPHVSRETETDAGGGLQD